MEAAAGRRIGRYVLFEEIASGGMATVHLGRLLGPAGFSRTVAIKSLHAQFAKDPEFVAMFLDEARLAARITHPNVVSTLDVVAIEKELFLVMEYVQGETLSKLMRALSSTGAKIPLPVVSAIVTDLLDGLQAAHEAKNERGEPLEIVHRDVSPQNVIVGRDGVARVLDFGIAKATYRLQTTRDGQVKGKFAYMSPEQLARHRVDRRTDVFAAAIVLWELITGERLFAAEDPAAVVVRVLNDPLRPPSVIAPVLPEVDAVVLRGLARDRAERFPTAAAMSQALTAAVAPAHRNEVAAWLESVAGKEMAERAERVARIESDSGVAPMRPPAVTAPTDPLGQPASDESSAIANMEAAQLASTRAGRGRWIVAGVLVAAIGTTLVLRQRLWTSVAPANATPSVIPFASSAPVAPPSQTASAEAPPPASTASPARTMPATTRVVIAHTATVASSATVTPKPDCDPPFFFNDKGLKQFKRGCL